MINGHNCPDFPFLRSKDFLVDVALSSYRAQFTVFSLIPLSLLTTLGIAEKDSAYNVDLIFLLFSLKESPRSYKRLKDSFNSSPHLIINIDIILLFGHII